VSGYRSWWPLSNVFRSPPTYTDNVTIDDDMVALAQSFGALDPSKVTFYTLPTHISDSNPDALALDTTAAAAVVQALVNDQPLPGQPATTIPIPTAPGSTPPSRSAPDRGLPRPGDRHTPPPPRRSDRGTVTSARPVPRLPVRYRSAPRARSCR
jgi:hypothetical protein